MMESQEEQLDTEPNFHKIDIKEEVFFELTENEICTSEENEESVTIKKELIDDQSLTSHFSNDIDLDEDSVFVKEEQEIDYVWSEDSLNEPDPLALPDADETQNTEEDTLPSVKLSRSFIEDSEKSKLQVHDAINKPFSGDRLFKCKYCDFSCTRLGNLKRHMGIHVRERAYKCKECAYSSSRLDHLKMHIMRHTGERPYKCTVCGYSCVKSGNLKTHMKRHSGEKPFNCKECDYSCVQSSDLTRHMIIHTTERPFKCKICDYSCFRLIHFRTHLKKHGEIPHKCKMCDYSSSRFGNLTRHMKVHSKETL